MKTPSILLVAAVLALQLTTQGAEKPARPAAKAAKRLAKEGGAAVGPGDIESVLTDAQRQQMRAFMQTEGASVRENLQKMAELRRELIEAALSGHSEPGLIKEKSAEIGQLESEQLRLRMMALSKIAGSFTPEQREKVKVLSERMNANRPGPGKRVRDNEPVRRGDPAAPPPPEK